MRIPYPENLDSDEGDQDEGGVEDENHEHVDVVMERREVNKHLLRCCLEQAHYDAAHASISNASDSCRSIVLTLEKHPDHSCSLGTRNRRVRLPLFGVHTVP